MGSVLGSFGPECDEYIRIFEYSNIQIFLIRIFVGVFVRIIFRIRIYSDIRSCHKVFFSGDGFPKPYIRFREAKMAHFNIIHSSGDNL